LSLAYQAGEVKDELDKSPDAFRTISEVAEDLDIPQHVLRFWETRFAQIKPLKRGGGRRYYRPDDVDLLRGIRRCLYDAGYTIKGLQRILKEQGARHVQSIGRGNAALGADQPAPASVGTIAPPVPGVMPGPLSHTSPPTPVAPIPPQKAASHAVMPAGAVTNHQTPTESRPAAFGAASLRGAQGLAALKATLFELDACRRMLDAAMSRGNDMTDDDA
jgi:DNA-binding transcriptional MerR regulator